MTNQNVVNAIRFSFTVELIDGVRVVRVTHDFWNDIAAPHIEATLSTLNLADAIQRHKRVTMVIKKGRPAAQGS